MVLIFYMKLYVFYIQRSSFGHSTDLLDLMVIFGLHGPMPLVQWTRNKISIKNSELIELNILNSLLALWQWPLGNQVLSSKTLTWLPNRNDCGITALVEIFNKNFRFNRKSIEFIRSDPIIGRLNVVRHV